MRHLLCACGLALLTAGCSGSRPVEPVGVNVSAGAGAAKLYGVHEITLEATSAVERPFEAGVRVTFVPDGGRPVTVPAFFDGGRLWRARTFVSQTGAWHWKSQSSVPQLNALAGQFDATASTLPGRLQPHPRQPRQWATERGDWFLNVSDTAYYLFKPSSDRWREYVHDDVRLGISLLRVSGLGGDRWQMGGRREQWTDWWRGDDYAPWTSTDPVAFDLSRFQTTDARLTWLLETYPDLYVQLILFGEGPYGEDYAEHLWFGLSERTRAATVRYMLARWAAFPNVIWQVNNDAFFGREYPSNRAFAREVGRIIAAEDPWDHLLSTGGHRSAPFPFATPEDDWIDYVHLEGAYELGADAIEPYAGRKQHVMLGEDYYEQDHPDKNPAEPGYFYRWLIWSWLLSGGSANYGGRWSVIHPYFSTEGQRYQLQWQPSRPAYVSRLTGLDWLPKLREFLGGSGVDLSLFTPDDRVVVDVEGRAGTRRPKLMRRDDLEFVAYHPNAAADGRTAHPGSSSAALRLDLREVAGQFTTEWFRPADGARAAGPSVTGGDVLNLVAPWQGTDVVLHVARSAQSAEEAAAMGRTRRQRR